MVCQLAVICLFNPVALPTTLHNIAFPNMAALPQAATQAVAQGEEAAEARPHMPEAAAAEVGDRVLLCEERLDFLCSVEESPGMPWPRAKFQVGRALQASRLAYLALRCEQHT